MKRTETIFRLYAVATMMLLVTFSSVTSGQAPAAFNYQAVLRDAGGEIRANESLDITLELHQGSSTGTSVYDETHSTSTNELGLVNLEVGSVDPTAFSAIDWSAGPYFLEVNVDGTSMGTSQLLSVPYALYAASAPPSELGENSVNSSHIIDEAISGADIGTDAVGSDEIATDAVGSDEIASGAVGSDEIANNSIGIDDLASAEFSGWDQDASDDFSGDYDDLTNKPASFDDADADPSNELQKLELSGETLSLTPDGGSVSLPFSGVEFANDGDILTWGAGTFEVKTLATLTMTIPSAGFIVLIHTGSSTFFGQGRRMYAGVGASASETTYDVTLGFLDGDANERFNIPYTVTAVLPVKEGTNTFFATGHGDDTFDNVNANMKATSFSGIFIPFQY